MEQRTDFKTVLIGILILLIGVVAAYFAFISDRPKNFQNKQDIAEFVPTPTPDLNVDELISTDSAKLSPTPLIPEKVKLVIESESTIPGVWRSELQKKIIDPFLDYYSTNDENKLMSLNIRINQQANKNFYPYLAEAIFDKNVKLSFVIEKNENTFNWWRPECLDKCSFTPEFAKKYPEIVKP